MFQEFAGSYKNQDNPPSSAIRWDGCAIQPSDEAISFTVMERHQTDWNKPLPLFLLAYRAAINGTTGLSPERIGSVWGRTKIANGSGIWLSKEI